MTKGCTKVEISLDSHYIVTLNGGIVERIIKLGNFAPYHYLYGLVEVVSDFVLVPGVGLSNPVPHARPSHLQEDAGLEPYSCFYKVIPRSCYG